MSQTWFIKTQSGKSGPYTVEDLQYFADKEKIKPNTALSSGSDVSWVKAKRVRGLHFTGEPSADSDHEEPSVMPDSAVESTSAEPFGVSTVAAQSDVMVATRNGKSAEPTGTTDQREAITAQRESDAARRESDLSSRESDLSKRESEFATREADLAKRDEILGQRELEVAERETQCAQRDSELATRESDTAQRDAELSRRDSECARRESELGQRESDDARRESGLSERESEFAARESKLRTRASEAADRDADFNRRETDLAQREEQCSQREQELAERDAECAQRESELANRETAASSRETVLAGRESEASERELNLTNREAECAQRESDLRQGEAAAVQRDATLTERDATYTSRQSELDQLAAELDRQQATQQAEVDELKARESECAAKASSLGTQQSELTTRQSECDALELDLRSLESDLASRVADAELRETELVHREHELRRREARFLARESDFARRFATGQSLPLDPLQPMAEPPMAEPPSAPANFPAQSRAPVQTETASEWTSGDLAESNPTPTRKVSVLPPRREPVEDTENELNLVEDEAVHHKSAGTDAAGTDATGTDAAEHLTFSPATDSVALRQAEYNRRFGPPLKVPRDPDSKIFVSIHPPLGDRHYTTLVTNGLSDYNMSKLKGKQSRAELIMYVQDVDPLYTEILESLAHVAEQRNMSFGYGVTINNGNPPQPIMEKCALNSFVFMIPMIDADFRIKDAISLDGEPLQMLWVTPITSAERDVIRRSGMDQFLELLEKYDHPLIFDPTRKCYAKRKWFKRP